MPRCNAVICALFTWLSRPIDYRGPWTKRARGGGPLLDELLDRRPRITTPRALPGEPLRISTYLERRGDQWN